jgi:L,D-peptidoglycan transpeptidase YkuD (ErfK/YbiS/YcfS/YnhG family)
MTGTAGVASAALAATETIAVPENLLTAIALFTISSTVALIAYIVRTQFKQAQLMATTTTRLEVLSHEHQMTEARVERMETRLDTALGRLGPEPTGPYPHLRKGAP